MKNISILGCGWLGFALAESLLGNGFSVNGSTTSPDKLALMEKAGISPFLISLSENGINGRIGDFLENRNLLIIDIPPKFKGPDKEAFVMKIGNLIPFIQASNVEKVLLISSTSVYEDHESFPEINEEMSPDAVSESGKQLRLAELSLQKNPHFKTTVLRFGGLTGEDRHPVKFLAGRENIENPLAPVNLIHRQDCIGIVTRIIEKARWGETYNAAAPFHPAREKYYREKALEKGLVPPQFSHGKSIGKFIDSGKLILDLDYEFLVEP